MTNKRVIDCWVKFRDKVDKRKLVELIAKENNMSKYAVMDSIYRYNGGLKVGDLVDYRYKVVGACKKDVEEVKRRCEVIFVGKYFITLKTPKGYNVTADRKDLVLYKSVEQLTREKRKLT